MRFFIIGRKAFFDLECNVAIYILNILKVRDGKLIIMLTNIALTHRRGNQAITDDSGELVAPNAYEWPKAIKGNW